MKYIKWPSTQPALLLHSRWIYRRLTAKMHKPTHTANFPMRY